MRQHAGTRILECSTSKPAKDSNGRPRYAVNSASIEEIEDENILTHRGVAHRVLSQPWSIMFQVGVTLRHQ